MSSERSITILVVDDNNHARSFVVDALRTAGFDVIEAATGAEGLRLASHGPDLIVLDVGLPDIDGRQVCRQIKDDPATASIPVVHISGMFQQSLDRARALEDGADAYLDRKSTRLNSSHGSISYAVFCLKKKKIDTVYDGGNNSSWEGGSKACGESNSGTRLRTEFTNATDKPRLTHQSIQGIGTAVSGSL